MQEMRVWPLGWEDPLEKEMATYSSILDWETSWTEGAWWATVHGVKKRARHDLVTKQWLDVLDSGAHIFGMNNWKDKVVINWEADK